MPLLTGGLVAVVGAVVLAAAGGSYLGSTIAIGLGYAVTTVGMVVQLGYSKQLAFSQSVFMGVGAYGTGILETRYGLTSGEAVLATIGLGLVGSLVIGGIVTRAPGLALALATLLLPLFLYPLATFSSYLGSFTGIEGIAPLWNDASYATMLVRSGIVIAIVLGLATAAALRVMRSGVGLQLMAMSEDERLAAGLGASLRQRRLEVFVFGSVLATVGGALVASSQGLVTPDILAEPAEITLLIMVFVAGRKSVVAAIGGAVVIEYLTTSSAFISTNLTTFEAIALVLVLLLEPDGVAGLVGRGGRALRGRLANRGAAGAVAASDAAGSPDAAVAP
ncbi:MAG: branched-chain amino acid ABC transporter permease [Actinomycetota bacterium]|nr:branched-chain amino acid ABC transporter permease [Actinomycetota bacterium]